MAQDINLTPNKQLCKKLHNLNIQYNYSKMINLIGPFIKVLSINLLNNAFILILFI